PAADRPAIRRAAPAAGPLLRGRIGGAGEVLPGRNRPHRGRLGRRGRGVRGDEPTLMPANPKLPLNECPWVTVFRLIDVTLRNDPDLQRVVRTWQSWEGDTGSAQEIAIAAAPAIQLTPVMGEESYWAADSMQGDLVIQVYMVIPGYCSDDVGNL